MIYTSFVLFLVMLSSIRFGKSFAVRKLTPSIYHSHQRHQSRPLSAIGAATDVGIRNQQLLDFLNVKAKVSAIPTRLNLLLNLLSLRGEVLLSPDDRQGNVCISLSSFTTYFT